MENMKESFPSHDLCILPRDLHTCNHWGRQGDHMTKVAPNLNTWNVNLVILVYSADRKNKRKNNTREGNLGKTQKYLKLLTKMEGPAPGMKKKFNCLIAISNNKKL